MTRLYALLLALTLCAMSPAQADPEPYLLEADRSRVGFTYSFGAQPSDGTMPVSEAILLIDLDRPDRSTVDVTVDVRGARTGFFLATEALKSRSVLNAAEFPNIRFQSTQVVREGQGARIDGDMTIRGVTQPVSLYAQFFRQAGTEPGDRDRLAIYLTGAVSRAAFGATGFANEVGDLVELRILARMQRVGA